MCDIHVTFALKRLPSTFLSLAQVFFSPSTLSFCSFLFQDTQRLGLHFVLAARVQRYCSALAQYISHLAARSLPNDHSMFASMTSTPVTIPVHEQSISDIQQSSRSFQDVIDLEDKLCPGCKKSAVSEQGGLVVAFG